MAPVCTVHISQCWGDRPSSSSVAAASVLGRHRMTLDTRTNAMNSLLTDFGDPDNQTAALKSGGLFEHFTASLHGRTD